MCTQKLTKTHFWVGDDGQIDSETRDINMVSKNVSLCMVLMLKRNVEFCETVN